ncbi:MAG: hypothetical protein ACOVQ3_09740 [Dolichospermum sp.]|jgi:hypothetical protein
MKIGDSLIFLDTSYNKTRGEISQGIIEKIGRTYFYVRVNHDLLKVTIQNFPIVTGDYNFIIFDSEDSYNSHIQHQNNLRKLEVKTKNLNLLAPDQVRRILEIIEE